ncbi:Putative beta-lactamase HcpC precursor [Planctomycetes bacterium Poly30]|uniref:Beta-lactamase HcpC n=1 Tax=Saltatorellus ferox TaxID=2528018 RepID=A0A518EZ38_9BACT|nr:Putative beta-lactamase HcpC precursor [Planctomycetes bacterium Poly30]
MTHIDVEILRTRARDGDPEAQFDLALRYSEGTGVPESPATAFRWLSKAAEVGHVEAMGALGRCYHGGLGCPEDLGLAIEWYEKALGRGADDVHADLAQVLCDERAEAHRDIERAVRLLREGWDRHEDAACAGILSELYEDEFRDEAESLKWARIAAEAGDGAAMVTLGYRHRFGEGVERDLKKMLYWYRRGAEHGDATAIANLAICYQNGEGVKVDSERAYALREEAAEMGHAGSRVWLAFALVDGTGCEPDPVRARGLLEELAEDDPEVAHDLADRLIDGPGLDQDVEAGLTWMQSAADRGYAPALTYLGVLAWYGKFVELDRAHALSLYQRAMELGDPYAVANVGFATLGGDEVPRDAQRGVELLVAAAEKGNAHAALWLAERWLEGAQDIPRDPARAVQILETCVAHEEDGDVLFHLAELVRDGRGVERNLERAMDLFQLAEINGRDSRVERGLLRRELR